MASRTTPIIDQPELDNWPDAKSACRDLSAEHGYSLVMSKNKDGQAPFVVLTATTQDDCFALLPETADGGDDLSLVSFECDDGVDR